MGTSTTSNDGRRCVERSGLRRSRACYHSSIGLAHPGHLEEDEEGRGRGPEDTYQRKSSTKSKRKPKSTKRAKRNSKPVEKVEPKDSVIEKVTAISSAAVAAPSSDTETCVPL